MVFDIARVARGVRGIDIPAGCMASMLRGGVHPAGMSPGGGHPGPSWGCPMKNSPG